MAVLLPLKGHGDYYIWKYVPSVPASVIFALLWIVISGFIGWRIWKARGWFCTAFFIGCLMEFIGYGARASAANKTDRLMPYVIQSAFILLPPALFAATVYMCLGRIIRLVGGDHLSIITPTIVTKVFLSVDIFTFLLQGGASGLMVMASTNPSMGTAGQDLVIAGLALQLGSFFIFAVTALIFHARIHKDPTVWVLQADNKWIHSLHMLYVISIMIIIRSIFRIVEYVMGDDGYALSHEWTLYVFDSIPMFACAVIFYFLFPSHLIHKRPTAFQLESQTSRNDIVPKP